MSFSGEVRVGTGVWGSMHTAKSQGHTHQPGRATMYRERREGQDEGNEGINRERGMAGTE